MQQQRHSFPSMSGSCELSQVKSALFCAETDLTTMASGQDDGGGGPPAGPHQDSVVVEGGDDIYEDSAALLEEIEEIGKDIDLETLFCSDLVPKPQRDDRAHGKGTNTADQGSLSHHNRNSPMPRLETQEIWGGGRPVRRGKIVDSELAPDQPQGRESKASSFTPGADCSSSREEEVSEIVEIGRWPTSRPTSKAAAVMASKTHPDSGLDAKEPPDRGPNSKASRVATPRTIGQDSDEEDPPWDPGHSNNTSRAAAPKKGGLDSDEEPWDPGPSSSKGSRAATPKTLQYAGLKTTGLDSNEDLPDQEPNYRAWRNEQTNTVSMSSATLLPCRTNERIFLSSHTVYFCCRQTIPVNFSRQGVRPLQKKPR